MQKRTIFNLIAVTAILAAVFSSTQSAKAQGNTSGSLSYSPYTMYGLGDLVPVGTASSLTMGGIGLGMRSPVEINYLNPASLSAISQQSSIFSFGARGTNRYLKTEDAKTAYNSFDISDVGFAVPLYRGIGLRFSLTPMSAIGFRSDAVDERPEIIQNIGRTLYSYSGEGGISQVGMGLGIQVVKGFSLGAEVKYYFGNIDRYYTAEIIPMLGQLVKYRKMISSEKTHVSQIGFNFGAQYSVRVGSKSVLTVGATYQPNVKISADTENLSLLLQDNLVDTISFSKTKRNLNIPAKAAIGVFYSNDKITAGLDYSMQDWKDAFEVNSNHNITLRSQNDLRFGFSYTPERMNLGSALKRWTYKIGAHYTESYLVKDGNAMTDIGFSFGVDIPLRRDSNSKITLGVDLGKRGTTNGGQISENYFKIFAGINFIGGKDWFYKQKFE